jgi:ribonuclease R
MKKLEFFERQLAERDPQVFDASVIDVRNYGLLVELPDVLLTGMVHVSSLTDDFYVFDPARRRLTARRSKKSFAAGAKLRVYVARVDRFKRQIDFAIADQPKARAQRPRRR